MTIAFDAYTASGAPGVNPSWSHVPSGTPRAAVVAMLYTQSDSIGWTYGGNAMTLVASFDNSVGGETAFLRLGIWLLDDCPSGTQTVAMTGGTSQVKVGGSYTLTADTEIEFITSDDVESLSVANPSMTLSLGGRTCWCHNVFVSGQDAVSGITPLTNWTADRETDVGDQVIGLYRFDTIQASDVSAGWTQSADDACGLSAAFAQILPEIGELPVGAFVLTGFNPDALTSDIAEVPQGVFALNGFDFNAVVADLQTGEVPQGIFSLNGFDLDALVSDTGELPAGVFTLAGFDFTANVSDPQEGQVPAGVFTLIGFDFEAEVPWLAQLPAGAFVLDGFDPEGLISDIADVPQGVFALEGFDFNAVVGDPQTGEIPQGTFLLTGFDFEAEVPWSGQVPTGIFSLVGLDFTAQVSSITPGADSPIVRWRRRGRR